MATTTLVDILTDMPYLYPPRTPIGYRPMRLSDFTKLDLMKRIVVVLPSGALETTEVRRDPKSGLTLKHTTVSR